MKNTIKLFGIIALVAVIGFSLTSCDGSSGGGGNFDFTATFRNNSSVAVAVEHDGGSWAGGSGFTLQPGQERRVGIDTGFEFSFTPNDGSVEVDLAAFIASGGLNTIFVDAD